MAAAEDTQQPRPAEDDYFSTNQPPANLKQHRDLASTFIQKHSSARRKMVLVTSGGTTVPLENQTVRFIDNFSAGTRGATSAEYFLDEGYAVIFLHRRFSLLPYSRHYSHSTNCFLDFMGEDETTGSVTVKPDFQDSMRVVLRKWVKVKQEGTLLMLPFETVTDYLWQLRTVSELLKPMGSSALFYLAAAVSDFFIPKERLAEHKIQSTTAGEAAEEGSSSQQSKTQPASQRLIVDLDPVPKFLHRLVDAWAPSAMIVSFKLETDQKLLLSKARAALERYSHNLVIGNLLSTRAWEVVFVEPGGKEKWVRIPAHMLVRMKLGGQAGKKSGVGGGAAGALAGATTSSTEKPPEIESLIVPEVVKLHRAFTGAWT